MNEDHLEKLIKKTQDKKPIAEYSQLIGWGHFIIDNKFEELQGKVQSKKLIEIHKGLSKIFRILQPKGSTHVATILEYMVQVEDLQAELLKKEPQISKTFRLEIKQLGNNLINLGQKLEKSG